MHSIDPKDIVGKKEELQKRIECCETKLKEYKIDLDALERVENMFVSNNNKVSNQEKIRAMRIESLERILTGNGVMHYSDISDRMSDDMQEPISKGIVYNLIKSAMDTEREGIPIKDEGNGMFSLGECNNDSEDEEEDEDSEYKILPAIVELDKHPIELEQF